MAGQRCATREQVRYLAAPEQEVRARAHRDWGKQPMKTKAKRTPNRTNPNQPKPTQTNPNQNKESKTKTEEA